MNGETPRTGLSDRKSPLHRSTGRENHHRPPECLENRQQPDSGRIDALRAVGLKLFDGPRRERLRERCSQLLRLETKWSRWAFIGDAAAHVDQINSVGPACVSSFRRIAEFVEDRGKLNREFSHASSGHKSALLFTFRTTENNLIFDIALHLPDVTGMRFGDVNHQESHAFPVLLIKLVESGSLPPEWRSGVASKHKHNRLRSIQFRKPDSLTSIQLEQ